MTSDAEVELLNRCRRGEPAAWDALFDGHYAATARFVFQLGSTFTREDVEEICQDTFLSVIKSLGSFHGECCFQTWLFRIAGNKARDYRERQQAAKRGGGRVPRSLQAEDAATGLVLDPPSTAPGPDTALVAAEQAALVGNALEQLGEPCRELVELRYFGDLSYEEIGSALTLNVKTVSSRLSRCLDRLEQIVSDIMARERTAGSKLIRPARSNPARPDNANGPTPAAGDSGAGSLRGGGKSRVSPSNLYENAD